MTRSQYNYIELPVSASVMLSVELISYKYNNFVYTLMGQMCGFEDAMRNVLIFTQNEYYNEYNDVSKG